MIQIQVRHSGGKNKILLYIYVLKMNHFVCKIKKKTCLLDTELQTGNSFAKWSAATS